MIIVLITSLFIILLTLAFCKTKDKHWKMILSPAIALNIILLVKFFTL